jgi:hypothetical protein
MFSICSIIARDFAATGHSCRREENWREGSEKYRFRVKTVKSRLCYACNEKLWKCKDWEAANRFVFSVWARRAAWCSGLVAGPARNAERLTVKEVSDRSQLRSTTSAKATALRLRIFPPGRRRSGAGENGHPPATVCRTLASKHPRTSVPAKPVHLPARSLRPRKVHIASWRGVSAAHQIKRDEGGSYSRTRHHRGVVRLRLANMRVLAVI